MKTLEALLMLALILGGGYAFYEYKTPDEPAPSGSLMGDQHEPIQEEKPHDTPEQEAAVSPDGSVEQQPTTPVEDEYVSEPQIEAQPATELVEPLDQQNTEPVVLETSQAKYKPQAIPIGPPHEQLDWPQGISVVGNTIYVLDGTVVKKIEKGKVQIIYNLKNLKPLLARYNLNLDNDEAIHTFRMAEMKYDGKCLYVSGVILRDRSEEEIVDKVYGKLAGESYNLLFVIENGKARILHLSKIRNHYFPEGPAFYETPDGRSGEYLQAGPNTIIHNYTRYIYLPRFTLQPDGTLVYVRQIERRDRSPYIPNPAGGETFVGYDWIEVVAYKDGQEKVLLSWRRRDLLGKISGGEELPMGYHHMLPVLKGNRLILYSGNVYIYEIDLKTGQVQISEISEDDGLLKNPLLYKDLVFFCDDRGIFTLKREVWKNRPVYTVYNVIDARTVPITNLYITDYDYDGKYFYIADYSRRVIWKIKP